MLKSGLDPDPWQMDLLSRYFPRTLVLCSRQAGKSQTAAAMALQTALLKPPATVLIISRAQRQSDEVLRKVKGLHHCMHGGQAERSVWTPRHVLELYATENNDNATGVDLVSDSQCSMEFANGSRIISLPGKPDTIVGYSAIALLIIDEAARVPDNTYKSLRPMLATSHGQLVALSTPFGRRGWFYEAWADCERRSRAGQDSAWHTVSVTADQCPRIPPAFLAEEILQLGERWYRQEYMCSFEDIEGSVFSGDSIERAFVDTEIWEL
jgi:hypothetical protein